ncbi:MAG: dynamin family protein [Anaerolineae bacterium]|jgi:small GTP-binding protein|nr:dynamin family protein [Anaerolineae bacterium]
MFGTLDGVVDTLRQQEVNLIADVAMALTEMGDQAQDDRKRLLEVAQDLREMFFLVVIIGEFNAGKSTFVNALIGDELLPMGITPTTEAIELIRYNDTPQRKPMIREEGLREWAHPNTGAQGVAIVDTPGTGSVFQKHESIAKSFLHRSDLVIFLLSAKRAFAETERLYLEMAKNYGKKIILVMNQIDLLEPAELNQVKRFVEAQVKEFLNIDPLIFTVSARESLKNRTGQGEASHGIEAVRAHLRGLFSEESPAKQKLLTQLETANAITRRYYDNMQNKVNLVGADTARVKQIEQELQQQSLGLEGQMAAARGQVDQVYKGLRERGTKFIETHLTLKFPPRMSNREKLQADFQDMVIGSALRDINDATNSYVNAVVDQSRLYWRSVIDRLNQLHELLEQNVSGLDAGVYAQQREGLQEAIRIAESELRSYSTGDVMTEMQTIFESNINGFTASVLATISGLVAIIAAAAAPGAYLVGGTATALTSVLFVVGAPVALVGGALAWRYYRKMSEDTKRDFNARVDRLEQSYQQALNELTKKERTRLSMYGSQVLTPIFSRLDALSKHYNEQQRTFRDFLDRIDVLRKSIEKSA